MPTTKTNKTPRKHLTIEDKEEKFQSAYDFWEKNPKVLVDELCKQFKTNRRELSAWLLNNGKPRPHGRIIGKGSPRQIAIIEAYEAAARKGETVGWAERYAEAKGFHVGKGDIRYYAMKNNLPYLNEAPPSMVRQESPNKLKL